MSKDSKFPFLQKKTYNQGDESTPNDEKTNETPFGKKKVASDNEDKPKAKTFDKPRSEEGSDSPREERKDRLDQSRGEDRSGRTDRRRGDNDDRSRDRRRDDRGSDRRDDRRGSRDSGFGKDRGGRKKQALPFLKKKGEGANPFDKFIKGKQDKDDKIMESLDKKTKKKLQRQIERDELYKDKSDKFKSKDTKSLSFESKTDKVTPKAEKADQPAAGSGVLRLNKYIAKSGLCSRRNAAELVKEGLILVNGEVLANPAYEMQEGDVVTHEGKVITPVEVLVYHLMNKPKNTITTTDDEKGRRTVMDVLADRVKEKVYPVGRLDRNTTGLLLFTNDGDLANKLSHPAFKMKKIYHATLDKEITPEHLEQIKKGLELEDGVAPVNNASLLDEDDLTRVGIDIHIGRNRIVRRIFEHLGYVVEKLDRVYYAGLTKKDLPKGFVRPLEKQEVIMLKHFTTGK